MVCSPGGTTIEGVQVLEEAGMRAGVINAIRAAVAKTQAL
ncbi:MAG: pyrroline-5-carboxylate reductase dimerization domain-containing protein [Eggerthellaceae bacterium]|nr:pyrroline-5-carboxylate reductase dimerization domain-containing protein [Eggerthellaceae bacterium]